MKTMFKSLVFKNQIIFCRQMSVKSIQNHRFSEFEKIIDSEKLKAKKYFIIEDKCNVLSKLNEDNCSQLLDTSVSKVFKWVFNQNSCALIQLNDNNFALKRDIRRRLGLDNSNKTLQSNLKFISLNTCPKLLADKPSKAQTSGGGYSAQDIQQMTSRRKDGFHLNAKYLRQSFKSNEELIEFLLYNKYFNDLDLKLRDFQILPFGSSLAGLGTPNSDLDLVLMPKVLSEEMSNKHEERQRLKSNLNLIADLLQYSVPFYSHFSRILNARIPIIKFGFDLAPIDIDLSIELSPYSVHYGIVMSAFLNYCIQLNPCVRDLILLLRIWAKQHSILKPKNWSTHIVFTGFTSFQLTSLVIYFLQKRHLIPAMNQFLDNSNQTFIPKTMGLDLVQLLSQFFEFVLTLRFEFEAISILEANTFPNPDSSPIHMQNPFETELNMCRNINTYKLEKFLQLSQISNDLMQTKDFHLSDIFDKDIEMAFNSNSSRIIVEDLFND